MEMYKVKITFLVFVLLIPLFPLSAEVYEKSTMDFAISVKDEVSAYSVLGLFVMPQENLEINIIDTLKTHAFRLTGLPGSSERAEPGKWILHAPAEKGMYEFNLFRIGSADTMKLNVFVMVPYDSLRGEYLNGYRIGNYPKIPLRNLPIYKPPRGFIEVTDKNRETLISPHFKIGSFVSKQASKYPKYVVLKERLLLKLELVLERVNANGIECSTFHVMSGYRTPFYNHAIGNVKYSRHVWGGATDLFIDEQPRDGYMDDINKDGKINYKDAAVIYEIVDKMYGKAWYKPFEGGLGLYRKNRAHGPFVHIDVRGFRARWGD